MCTIFVPANMTTDHLWEIIAALETEGAGEGLIYDGMVEELIKRGEI